MTSPLSDGSSEIIPITFGNLYPPDLTDINFLAKFLRSTDIKDENIYTNSYFTSFNPEIKIFPVVAIYNNTQFGFLTNGNAPIGTKSPSNCYAVINSGSGQGQIRQVVNFIPNGTDNVVCTTSSVWFYEDDGATVVPSITNNDTRSWVQFLNIERDFLSDSWPCYDFKKADGTTTSIPELYTLVDNKFNRIADFGFSVTSTDNNSIDVDGQQYSENIDTLKSFCILPVTSLELETSSTLNYYGSYLGNQFSTMVKKYDGVYTDYAASAQFDANISSISDNELYNPEHVYDRDYNTYAQYAPQSHHNGSTTSDIPITYAVKFGLPTLPENIDIKNIYIGLRTYGATAHTDNEIAIGFKRFAYNKTIDTKNNAVSALTTNMDDLPDFYYISNIPVTNSLNFYRKEHTTPSGEENLYGYENFKIEITKEEYSTYLNGVLLFSTLHTDTWPLHQVYFKIYDIAIILELNDSTIEQKIFSPMTGRIYDDTWETRKTSGNLISNPIDIIEHCKRLQNWSENTSTVFQWGKEYAITGGTEYHDKIKISGSGSFDDSSLDMIKTNTPSFQIFEKDRAYTSEIVKKLCQTYDVISSINTDGYECVYSLDYQYPTETISFADINGDIGEVIEPKVENVFCEPSVNYLYNIGTEKFSKNITVKNIAAYTGGSSWENCSDGFDSQADAETILGICKTLYDRFKSIEKCPSDFTDQTMIRTYSDALAYLQRKISIMSYRRINLSVFYSKGKSYYVGYHLILKLPHQTRNYEIECIIERIEKNKNNKTVSLELIILSDIAIAWQNTVDTGTEYQDTETTGDEYQVISA
jgi:hypothetical protein